VHATVRPSQPFRAVPDRLTLRVPVPHRPLRGVSWDLYSHLTPVFPNVGTHKRVSPHVGEICDTTKMKTTLGNGYLGSRNDEERSEMRYVMRIAELSESSNL
jgi:hypothetical protein